MYDSLRTCDDMWTQFCGELINQFGGTGELWYEKGERVTRYRDTFIERWVPRYAKTKPKFKPDVIFSRGGFGFQRRYVDRFPEAFKIYYGAGERVVPKEGEPWDLVLSDTPKQMAKARARGYRAELFIKPAAENIFKPEPTEPRPFDVIYVANWNGNANKGHKFLLPALNASGLKTLHVGIKRDGWPRKHKNITFMGWVPRRSLPSLYGQAKCAVVATVGKDSCPRVIPEALACDCPIAVSRGTQVWSEKYITDQTGMQFDKSDAISTISAISANSHLYSPRRYYDTHLALPIAAKLVCRMVEDYVRR